MDETYNKTKVTITSGKAIHPVIEKIEDFIEHYYNGDYIVKHEAFSVPCSYNYQKGNLANFLATSLSNYLTAKGNQDPHTNSQHSHSGTCMDNSDSRH